MTLRSKKFVIPCAMGSLSKLGVLPLKASVMPLKYPKVDRDETCIDIIHGREVRDPYRQ